MFFFTKGTVQVLKKLQNRKPKRLENRRSELAQEEFLTGFIGN
jgi:hypothetical protein